MYSIKTMNKISKLGLDLLDKSKYTCSDDAVNADAILVRSASLHEVEFESSIKAIARAGAGVNNIPIDRCTEQGIVVFNTPGANANAVKELVVLGLLISSRKVAPSLEWIKTLKGSGDEVSKLVEKGKGQFVGPEIMGKTLGVIGLGAIGALVANAAVALGMKVCGYDPFLSVEGALRISNEVEYLKTQDEVYAKSDYITLHIPATAETKGSINAAAIAKMKDGVRLLNFSRGELVVSGDILAALKSGKMSTYVTDFASDDIIGEENVVAFPHLGASTPESEDNCAKMAVLQTADYLENGNIVNSVNIPAVKVARGSGARITVIYKDGEDMVSKITNAAKLDIESVNSKVKKDVGYAVIDLKGDAPKDAAEAISKVNGVIKVNLF
ncbi:MAG: 3-phosphoglycerate dehydrogenase [Oscillospiraceae bacterium]|nr:3-phosphoglycerate dehydrogenase [Oscillospiraceae bacterium]